MPHFKAFISNTRLMCANEPVRHQKRTLLPQQQVDEHSDGEEGASDGRVTAQEEEEVAEKAEKDHPDHVKFKEQVESVEASGHCAQVFQIRREAWHSKAERSVITAWQS